MPSVSIQGSVPVDGRRRRRRRRSWTIGWRDGGELGGEGDASEGVGGAGARGGRAIHDALSVGGGGSGGGASADVAAVGGPVLQRGAAGGGGEDGGVGWGGGGVRVGGGGRGRGRKSADRRECGVADEPQCQRRKRPGGGGGYPLAGEGDRGEGAARGGGRRIVVSRRRLRDGKYLAGEPSARSGGELRRRSSPVQPDLRKSFPVASRLNLYMLNIYDKLKSLPPQTSKTESLGYGFCQQSTEQYL